PVLALAALAGIARSTLGSWLAPGAFFPLFWTGLYILSLAAHEYYPLWSPALWWIDFSLLFFYVGSLTARFRLRRSPMPTETRTLALASLETFTIACSVLGICYAVFRERYAPDLLDKPPSWYQVFLGILYATPLLGGILYATRTGARAKLVALFSLLP